MLAGGYEDLRFRAAHRVLTASYTSTRVSVVYKPLSLCDGVYKQRRYKVYDVHCLAARMALCATFSFLLCGPEVTLDWTMTPKSGKYICSQISLIKSTAG